MLAVGIVDLDWPSLSLDRGDSRVSALCECAEFVVVTFGQRITN